jgi:hypothetical protein
MPPDSGAAQQGIIDENLRTEHLLFQVLELAYGRGKFPPEFAEFEYLPVAKKIVYLERLRSFFADVLTPWATLSCVQDVIAFESAGTTVGDARQLAEKAHLTPSPSEMMNVTRKHIEAQKRFRDQSEAQGGPSAPGADARYPSVQAWLPHREDGPLGAPAGKIRCYTTVGEPHCDDRAKFKDVWRDARGLRIFGGMFWFSAGMPSRQLFYLYKYLLDGKSPNPVIRSFTVDKSAWYRVANQSIVEADKAAFDDAGLAYSLNVDGNRAANQFGVSDAMARMLEKAGDPKSLYTIGIANRCSHLDPKSNGTFCDVAEFARQLGQPARQLNLPGGNTVTYSVTGKATLVAAKSSATAQLATAVDLVTGVILRDAKPQERLAELLPDAADRKQFAQWFSSLLSLNGQSPRAALAVDQPGAYGKHNNNPERARWETRFAYFVMTNPRLWLGTVKKVNQQLEQYPLRLDTNANQYLQHAVEGPVPHDWKLLLRQAVERLESTSIGANDRYLQAASVLFFAYRPLFRQLNPAPYKIDVKVNTREIDVDRIIATTAANGPVPFGLKHEPTGFPSFHWPPDPLRSLNQFRPDAAATYTRRDVVFAGGISGTTRDYTVRLVPSNAVGHAKASAFKIQLDTKEYWEFQILNAAFMIAHGYHSLYECLQVALLHPGSFPNALSNVGNITRDWGDQTQKAESLYRRLLDGVAPELWRAWKSWSGLPNGT